jgi:hypothetical protein
MGLWSAAGPAKAYRYPFFLRVLHSCHGHRRRDDAITGASGRFQAKSVEDRNIRAHVVDKVPGLEIVSRGRDTRTTHTQTLSYEVLRNGEGVGLETVLRR